MAAAVATRTEGGENLFEFLKDRADLFGTRTALLYKPGFRYLRWSYDEVRSGSEAVASLVQSRGLRKGDRVLLWGHNSPQWVMAFFGCLRAGVVLVPLDLRSAPDFVRKVVSKTSPKMAFVSRATPRWHDELGLPEVGLDGLEVATEGLPAPAPVEVGADDLAEVMFTSGTTGDPKGVMLSHGNLLSNLEAASQYVYGTPSDRLLSLLPLSHMFEQMGGLLLALRGGANVTYPTSRQPTVLFRTMSERRVTLMLLVPQALDLFMKGIEREVRRQGKERVWGLSMRVARYVPFRLRKLLFRRVHQRFGGSLGLVFSGGAALDPELGAKWERLGVRIIQGYGATEASPVISCHTMQDPRYDSVGRPLPGVDVRTAEDGEVLIRGPNITSGYWEAPEQTAAAFDGDWYRSGDQGYLDEGGFLHLRGRKKDMIVLASGENVYPEDVEAVLLKHPDVSDAVVVGLSRGADTEVHAVLLLERADSVEAVVSWANGQLAEHQQIRGSTAWPDEDFPRTHTLKVKKGVVVDRLMGVETAAPAAVPAAQGSKDAADVGSLIAEVGGLSRAAVAASSSLGGDLNLDSLKRVELLSAIEGELGVYLDESEVDGDTTVQALEGLVAKGTRSTEVPRFATWGMATWARMARGFLQRFLVFPFLRVSYGLSVSGTENLRGVEGPVLFAANHCLPFDNGLIIKSFPGEWRRRLAIAGAAKLWRNPLWATLNPLLGNGFAFSQEGAVRASLDNMGRIMDEGWSVLIYPEGKLTVGGPMQPFMSGAGLMAVEGRLAVVPMRLDIRHPGRPLRLPLLRRGRVEVGFGRPVTFGTQTSYLEATAAIEDAVRAV